ncbi:hypothetical protein GCM10009841_04670 [Microlunatus panaciterrae]|uniref:Flp pilus assembly protein TadG n=1 Tax=Microlunatus panaciterrae TaxID=400768 RepID=A0ABS2RIQ6_9ACTN|nr:TadE family protein [Microlunatus panaciterrae]MBM7798875.1 Flp pilus assembly protein TadG [Microlunatus panaciterrae]
MVGRRVERGLSQSVQYALVLPVLMLSTLGIIQAGVWTHGRNVAEQAASAAADAARGSRSSATDGERVGRHVAAVGGLTEVSVQVSRTTSRVEVTVTGRIPMFFDLGLGAVTEYASAPVERISRP